MGFYTALRIAYFCSLLLTCLVGLTRGGRDERAAVMIVLTGSVLTVLVERPILFDWRDMRTGLILVDTLVLIAFFALAMRTNRFWPLWATAFHLIAVASHFVIYLRPRQILQAYALVQGFWAYPIFLTILIGALGPRPRPGREAIAS